MVSHRYFKSYGLVLVIFTVVVQSVPIEKPDNTVQTSSLDNNKLAVNQYVDKFIDLVKSTTISTAITTTTKPTDSVSHSSLSPSTTAEEKTDNKKKRFIEDDEGIDDDINFNDENNEFNSFKLPYVTNDDVDGSLDAKFHATVQETEAKIHDNTDKTPDTDDSEVFSDIKMKPSELTSIVRRRRSIQLKDVLNSRRKRALSSYDIYDTDSFYDPYIDTLDYDRYTRSFAPIYWYPSTYERRARSSSSSNYPIIYAPAIDENPLPLNNDDDDDAGDDENGYEVNRYPVLDEVSSDLLDDLQLQEQYNRNDLPIGGSIEEILNESDNNDDDDDNGDDDEDEVSYTLMYQGKIPEITRYEPLETFLIEK